MVIGTDAFEGLAREIAASLGLPNASLAAVEHPIGGLATSELHARADAIVDSVIDLLTD